MKLLLLLWKLTPLVTLLSKSNCISQMIMTIPNREQSKQIYLSLANYGEYPNAAYRMMDLSDRNLKLKSGPSMKDPAVAQCVPKKQNTGSSKVAWVLAFSTSMVHALGGMVTLQLSLHFGILLMLMIKQNSNNRNTSGRRLLDPNLLILVYFYSQ